MHDYLWHNNIALVYIYVANRMCVIVASYLIFPINQRLNYFLFHENSQVVVISIKLTDFQIESQHCQAFKGPLPYAYKANQFFELIFNY